MNRIFTHPGQPQMQVEVILASQGPDQKPIYTIRMRYPRIIHGEIMTHRVFSRNARSSRAVPVKTMLNEVRTIPFVPWHWGKNQKGMQADQDCNELVIIKKFPQLMGNKLQYKEFTASRENAWYNASTSAAMTAEAFMNAGYHKQIPNRLLEPFSWIDTLITSTDWANFLWLRDHKDAEPHLQDLARLVKQAIEDVEINKLEPGEWHLPYISRDDRVYANGYFDLQQHVDDPITHRMAIEWLRKISAARCARISYKPFDGDASYEKELARYDMLVTSDRVHASPTEHQATPDLCVYEWGDIRLPTFDKSHLHGNLTGYIQARKLIPNEAYKG